MTYPKNDAIKPVAWYCVKAQVKREHLAAVTIRTRMNIPVFCPRISFYRNTRRGKVKYTEALFPGYLFVQCELATSSRFLLSMQGVKGFVCHGQTVVPVPTAFIDDLKEQMPDEHCESSEPLLLPGSEVVVMDGPLSNSKGVLANQLMGRERVQILLDLMGRQLTVEFPTCSVMPTQYEPKRVFFKEA